MMNGTEKSDSAIVAVKPANKARQMAAEWVEPRAGTKGNTGQPHTRRTQSRCSVPQGLDRVRNAARLRKKEKFSALLHHVTVEVLWDAFLVLSAIYEEDFLGFSYGFRPGRSQHDALDALAVGIDATAVNWILDADIRSFFDKIDQQWLVTFLKHRIGDERIIRLVRKWLKAGVMDDGVWSLGEAGTPQGAVVSPLLANVFLHYVFDLWAVQWRRRRATGNVIFVRYADDIVAGFEHEACLLYTSPSPRDGLLS